MTKEEMQEILTQCRLKEVSVDDAMSAIWGETMDDEAGSSNLTLTNETFAKHLGLFRARLNENKSINEVNIDYTQPYGGPQTNPFGTSFRSAKDRRDEPPASKQFQPGVVAVPSGKKVYFNVPDDAKSLRDAGQLGLKLDNKGWYALNLKSTRMDVIRKQFGEPIDKVNEAGPIDYSIPSDADAARSGDASVGDSGGSEDEMLATIQRLADAGKPVEDAVRDFRAMFGHEPQYKRSSTSSYGGSKKIYVFNVPNNKYIEAKGLGLKLGKLGWYILNPTSTSLTSIKGLFGNPTRSLSI